MKNRSTFMTFILFKIEIFNSSTDQMERFQTYSYTQKTTEFLSTDFVVINLLIKNKNRKLFSSLPSASIVHNYSSIDKQR